jgi:serine/threonine protein kinase
LIAEDHPKVEDLVSLMRSVGFSVATIPVEKAADARRGRAWRRAKAREHETEWKVGDIIENLYEVQRIEQGGMGAVYVVRHRRWNTMMAVKSLLPRLIENEEERALFVKEAETWIDIGFHPNIASCYYVRNIQDSPRIFIEYIDGGSISEWLKMRRPVGWDLLIDLMVQVGDGLGHAHSKGLVHRDVKPANCLMTKDGVLKVTDFGLTKRQSTSGVLEPQGLETAIVSREEITAAGMGTPGYMAPEMWIPHSEIGPQADVYAFGVMFFEICCGRKPFVLKPGDWPLPTSKWILPDQAL